MWLHAFTPKKFTRKDHLTYTIPTKVRPVSDVGDVKFHGGALDTGAQKEAIGLNQAKAYCREVGIQFKPARSNICFRFGAGIAKSLGKIPVVLSTPQSIITVWVDVVGHDIPFLMGLTFSISIPYKSYPSRTNLNPFERDGASTLNASSGLYWEWSHNMDAFFSRPQLKRLHRRLLHPSSRILYNLLKPAFPQRLLDTKRTLEDIRKTCETCQLYSPRQLVFCIRDSDGIRFNQEPRLDVVYLEGPAQGDGKRRRRTTFKQLPVLQIVDVGTKFQNAAFLPALDTITVWNTFLMISAATYVGFPESMLKDQGSVFVSKEWEHTCELSEIELRHIGTESHNSLGVGETYHALLRRLYQKTRAAHLTVEPAISLALTIKAINSTVGSDGLCPQLMVFDVMPRLPGISKQDFPAQKERLRTLQTARNEYEKLVSK